jgi:GT2 family glycosyltransferase
LGIGGVASHSHKRIPKGKGGYFNRATLIQEFSAVTAACMLLPKKVFLEIDGFDEENLTVAFNDVDLCLRIREKGYRIVWTPYAELYHHESLSRGEDRLDEKNKRFFLENEFMLKKWKTWIENDPAYSPNLTLKAEDFSFAWPPRVDLYE